MRHWKGWDAEKFLNQSKHTSSWCERLGTGAEIVTTHNSKARVWRWLWVTNSNLNLAKPFIVLIIWHWKGWDLRCCELLGPIQTHTILAKKVDKCKANFDPIRTSTTHRDDHSRAHIPISTFFKHSSYLWWEIGRVEMLWNSWINPNILHLGLKPRVLEPKEIVTTHDSKVGVGW